MNGDEAFLKLKEFIEKKIECNSYELIELNFKRNRKTLVIDIIADRPSGGINIDECSRINKDIALAIEEDQLVEGDYVVEVSSPGLDRPLKNMKDFNKVLGKEVRFHLFEKVADKLEHLGMIKDVAETVVTVETKKGIIKIEFNKISKAVQSI